MTKCTGIGDGQSGVDERCARGQVLLEDLLERDILEQVDGRYGLDENARGRVGRRRRREECASCSVQYCAAEEDDGRPQLVGVLYVASRVLLRLQLLLQVQAHMRVLCEQVLSKTKHHHKRSKSKWLTKKYIVAYLAAFRYSSLSRWYQMRLGLFCRILMITAST